MTILEPSTDLRTAATRFSLRIWSAASAGIQAAHIAARTEWRGAITARRVLLIDLDSIGLPMELLPHALAQVRSAVGPWQAAYAAGHPLAARSWGVNCRMLGVHVLPTTKRRNSADNALIRAATDLVHSGVNDFVVISHDGDLAKLPGRVTVVTFGRCDLSSKLVERGDVVQLTLSGPRRAGFRGLASPLDRQKPKLSSASVR